MVKYTRLWETMKKKGISQYRLITYYKVSAGQIGRLKKNMHVSTHTLEMLCNILQCPVEDIVEIELDGIPEKKTAKSSTKSGPKTKGKKSKTGSEKE